MEKTLQHLEECIRIIFVTEGTSTVKTPNQSIDQDRIYNGAKPHTCICNPERKGTDI